MKIKKILSVLLTLCLFVNVSFAFDPYADEEVEKKSYKKLYYGIALTLLGGFLFLCVFFCCLVFFRLFCRVHRFFNRNKHATPINTPIHVFNTQKHVFIISSHVFSLAFKHGLAVCATFLYAGRAAACGRPDVGSARRLSENVVAGAQSQR